MALKVCVALLGFLAASSYGWDGVVLAGVALCLGIIIGTGDEF